MNKEIIRKAALIIAGLPLIAYPFFLLANVMSFGVESQGAGKIFLIMSTLYPVIFVYVVSKYGATKNSKYINGLYVYLAIVVISFLLWGD